MIGELVNIFQEFSASSSRLKIVKLSKVNMDENLINIKGRRISTTPTKIIFHFLSKRKAASKYPVKIATLDTERIIATPAKKIVILNASEEYISFVSLRVTTIKGAITINPAKTLGCGNVPYGLRN